jgi:hypothetical protein
VLGEYPFQRLKACDSSSNIHTLYAVPKIFYRNGGRLHCIADCKLYTAVKNVKRVINGAMKRSTVKSRILKQKERERERKNFFP